ncbi:MAG: LacI family DNA-binding transcriptional regulator [Oscillospiraceae bacterium]|nr:LacI family DNA-binding transcriptional regulator [Oscillospiraceae bacterium]
MVTIKMIAQKCGCSPATVSKALNGAPDVGAETAKMIRNTAAEMGYTPNSAARTLKTTRTHNFGVLFEDATNSGLTHEFFSRILESFKHRAEELGYDISFISEHLGGREVSYIEHVRYRGYDGVVIASIEYTAPGVQELVSSGIPVVTIDYEFNDCSSVVSDNVQGMRELVTYVHSLGHNKIAFVHGEDTAVTRIRVASFYRICAELGIEVPPEYVVPLHYHDPSATGVATRMLMQLENPPTCILFPDDISYIGGMNELDKLGISVPGEVSVAGYDGVQICQMLKPKLTTLRQDAESMGTCAAEELARAVEEGKLHIPRRIVVKGQLLSGDTVGPVEK